MAALQAEHFLQEHGSSAPDKADDVPTANGDAAAPNCDSVAPPQPVAAL